MLDILRRAILSPSPPLFDKNSIRNNNHLFLSQLKSLWLITDTVCLFLELVGEEERRRGGRRGGGSAMERVKGRGYEKCDRIRKCACCPLLEGDINKWSDRLQSWERVDNQCMFSVSHSTWFNSVIRHRPCIKNWMARSQFLFNYGHVH